LYGMVKRYSSVNTELFVVAAFSFFMLSAL
jgi:hypothetical protein